MMQCLCRLRVYCLGRISVPCAAWMSAAATAKTGPVRLVAAASKTAKAVCRATLMAFYCRPWEKMSKTIDTKGYAQTEQRYLQQFRAFSEKLKEKYPNALCLGSGGCRICPSCAYPSPLPFSGESLCFHGGLQVQRTKVPSRRKNRHLHSLCPVLKGTKFLTSKGNPIILYLCERVHKRSHYAQDYH